MSDRLPASTDGFDPRTHYRQPAVARSYDRVRFGGVSGSLVHALERRMILRALGAAGGLRTVLDLPVGTGRLIPALREAGYEPIGADIASGMVARARDRVAGTPLIVADGDALPLRGDSVDAVVCLRLLPHLDQPARERLLREAARVARVEVVAVYQPHKLTMWYALRSIVLRQRLPRHYVSHDDIIEEAARCGLVVRASVPLLPAVFMERAFVFVHASPR